MSGGTAMYRRSADGLIASDVSGARPRPRTTVARESRKARVDEGFVAPDRTGSRRWSARPRVESARPHA